MLKIRLKKVGRKRLNFFRIIVVNDKQCRDTDKYIANIGYYQPSEVNNYVKINLEKYDLYIKNGAQPTDRIVKLYQIASKYISNDVITKNKK